MENAGNESVPTNFIVLQTTNGAARRNAYISGYIPHTVLLSSVDGGADTDCMLAHCDVAHQTDV